MEKLYNYDMEENDMARLSRLPKGGENLFQAIKKKTVDAEKAGKKIYKLSIGQPVGSAMLTARVFATLAVMMGVEEIHEYQDNGASGVTRFFRELEKLPMMKIVKLLSRIEEMCQDNECQTLKRVLLLQGKIVSVLLDCLNDCDHSHVDKENINPVDFAKEFCQFHNNVDFDNVEGLGFVPIPGIKPMLPLVLLACGVNRCSSLNVSTMTSPGYPVPDMWSNYVGYNTYPLPLLPENEFRFSVENIHSSMDLLMLNYPHNPSGQTVTEEWWHEICEYCQKYSIRIFNDAAYAKLAFGEHCTLADVAVQYSDLSWAEAYSASKLGCNFTGWRIGAIVGSDDFVGDISTIKGNTDSGFFAPAAVGVLVAIRYEQDKIAEYCQTFQYRQQLLCWILQKRGMRLAVEPRATFFNLWQIPKYAFGEVIRDAKHFNYLMIEKGGLVGVHFEPYYRCAVVADIFQKEFVLAVENAFNKAEVEY